MLMGSQDDAMKQGFAGHAGAETSTFDVPAHKLWQALIENSPSPETMAREFLTELVKCGILAVHQLVDALDSDSPANPHDWAAIVHHELGQNGGNKAYITDLASYYLSNLIIAFRNPGGKKTPQDSIHPSPDPGRVEEIASLLEEATGSRSQSALRELVFRRDGYRCPVTDYSFITVPGEGIVLPRCAHIIPFSIHSKVPTHQAIEMFTGKIVTAELVAELINHPANAINIETNAHDAMDKNLAWGIEARMDDNKWKYYFRVVRAENKAATIKLDDGDEIEFGRGTSGDIVALPNPLICNLHLAIARVFAASGAAEVFDKYLEDDEDYMTQVPVYFGGPFFDDDALMRRIEVQVT